MLRGLHAGLIEHLLLLQGIGHLGRLAGKVEILSDRLLGDGACAKRVIIEVIVGFVELVAEAVVGFFKVDAGGKISRSWGKGRAKTYASSAAAPPRAAKASCWLKPGALVEWPPSRGKLVSKPKKDMVGCCPVDAAGGSGGGSGVVFKRW